MAHNASSVHTHTLLTQEEPTDEPHGGEDREMEDDEEDDEDEDEDEDDDDKDGEETSWCDPRKMNRHSRNPAVVFAVVRASRADVFILPPSCAYHKTRARADHRRAGRIWVRGCLGEDNGQPDAGDGVLLHRDHHHRHLRRLVCPPPQR